MAAPAVARPVVRPERLEARWAAIQAAMRDGGLDFLAICGTSAIGQFGFLAFATGFAPATRMACAVFAPQGPPVLYVPSQADRATVAAAGMVHDVRVTGEADALPASSVVAGVARQILAAGGRRVGVVGMRSILTAGQSDTLKALLASVEVRDATALVAGLKSRKPAWELAEIRDAARLVESALEEAERTLAEGVPAQRVIARAERVLREQGAWRTMVFADSAAHYARMATGTVVERHRLVTVMIEAASATGYWAELADVFCLGTPREVDERIGRACYEALHEIERAVRPGAPVAEPMRILQAVGRAHGLGLGRGLGHGIGVDHDLPSLTAASDEVFVAGQVLSVHPHYHCESAGVGGVVARTMIVGDDTAEVVSRRPPGLKVIG
jgi:Xaa-Pro aminopeptidase